MEKPTKPVSELAKKRKRKSNTNIKASEPKTIKLNKETPQEKSKKNVPTTESTATQKPPLVTASSEGLMNEDIAKKYPILQDKELVARFLKVPFNNNQRGRIRQAIKLQLQSSNNESNPDAIYGKIKAIMKDSNNFTDSELRRLRILYNMLNTTVTGPQRNENEKKKKKKNKKKTEVKEKKEDVADEVSEDESVEKEKKEQLVTKVKGPKRYVVFVGNLPNDVTEEKILDHFSEFRDRIKDVRLPKHSEKKKSAIAFVELSDEPTYEMALSKHHSMMMNKRINVLYSTQQNSKISKAEAKSKSAKLIALQKSGKLLGSVPLEKKRSQRRLKAKKAQAKQAAASA